MRKYGQIWVWKKGRTLIMKKKIGGAKRIKLNNFLEIEKKETVDEKVYDWEKRIIGTRVKKRMDIEIWKEKYTADEKT